MPLYEVTEAGLASHTAATFAALGMYERAALQRLLRDDITARDPDLLVIAEEFGQWEDARRRIDLLALDRNGQLVVIELKRTDDGGHMELQAIRYAAMVSSMGLDEVVSAYAAHCARNRPADDVDARAEVLAHLGLADAADEAAIATDVRIVLVSADFGREVTSTVLWLNRFEGMDIRCVRLIPYEIGGRVLLDIQQVLPLPEAADYQVRLRRKDAARERAVPDGRDRTRFHLIVDGTELPAQAKRTAIRAMVRFLVDRGIAVDEIRALFPTRLFRSLPGRLAGGESVRAALVAADPRVEPHRWFTDHPFVDEAKDVTWVLTSQWGRNTEGALRMLADAFPAAGVTFRSED